MITNVLRTSWYMSAKMISSMVYMLIEFIIFGIIIMIMMILMIIVLMWMTVSELYWLKPGSELTVNYWINLKSSLSALFFPSIPWWCSREMNINWYQWLQTKGWWGSWGWTRSRLGDWRKSRVDERSKLWLWLEDVMWFSLEERDTLQHVYKWDDHNKEIYPNLLVSVTNTLRDHPLCYNQL